MCWVEGRRERERDDLIGEDRTQTVRLLGFGYAYATPPID